jgi:hypothetical protein
MATYADGSTLYRVAVVDVGQCARCGLATRWTWLYETGTALRVVGFACCLLCAERRTPAAPT